MGLSRTAGRGGDNSFTGFNLRNQNNSEVEETERKGL